MIKRIFPFWDGIVRWIAGYVMRKALPSRWPMNPASPVMRIITKVNLCEKAKDRIAGNVIQLKVSKGAYLPLSDMPAPVFRWRELIRRPHVFPAT